MLSSMVDGVMHKPLVTDLYELGLLPRIRNALLRGEVLTIADLAKMSDEELLAIYQIGPRHVVEIRTRLAEYFTPSPVEGSTQIVEIENATRSEWPFAHLLTDAHLVRLPDAENLISRLGLSLSAMRVLVRAEVRRISQLARLTARDVASIRGLGPSIRAEIEHCLLILASRLMPDSASPETSSDIQYHVEAHSTDPADNSPLALLSTTQRKAVTLRYGLRDGREFTLAEVGLELDLTRERIRQLVNKALEKFLGERSVQLAIANLLREIDRQGGLTRGAELQPWLDRFMFPSVNPRGAVALLRALSTPIVIVDVADDWLCLYDVDDRGEAFKRLGQLCQRLAMEGPTYPLSQLVALLQARADLPQLVQVEFAQAFLRSHPACVVGSDGTVNLSAWQRPRRGRPPLEAESTASDVSDSALTSALFFQASAVLDPSTTASAASPAAAEWPVADPDRRQRPEWQFRHHVLDQWERDLAPRFRQISLVGEALIPAPACQEIGQAIGTAFAGKPIEVRGVLETRYPATAATFLVSQGVHGYEQGSYWAAIEQALGVPLDGNWRSALGQFFERYLETQHLPLFPEMRDKSLRYMSLILAHGGIPLYCLGDFFDGVVKPSLRPELASLDLETRLGEVLAHYNGDRPVLYFLENGGKVALDFYQRACDLLRQRMENGLIAPEQGLPNHVIQFFEDWAPKHAPRRGATRHEAGRSTGKAPELILEPWGQGLILRLYSQAADSASDSQAAWVITELAQTLPVRISFGRTVERDIAIPRPAPDYNVSLTIGEKILHWTIRAYAPEAPVMAFHGESGRRLPRLTSDGLYLLIPETHQLKALEGEAICTETLPRTVAQWRGEGWDLSAAQAVELVTAEDRRIRLGLRNSDLGRPYLSGEPVFSTSSRGDLEDGYVGRPPTLHIPMNVDQADGADERGRWTLSVHSQGDPAHVARHPLATLPPSAIAVSHGELRLDLADPALLGPEPCGVFRLRLTGPLGRDREFSLALLPRFKVLGLQPIYLPRPAGGSLPAIIQVQLDRGERLELGDEARDLSLRALPDSRFEVKAGADVTELPLVVVHERDDGHETRVPVSITVPRLRWRLAGAGATHSDWTGQALTFPLTALLEETVTTFVVHAPGTSPKAASFELQCLDTDEQTLMVLPLTRRGRAPYWQCDLVKLHETWRRSPSSGFRVVLTADGLQTSESHDAWISLQVSRTLLAQDLQVQTTSSESSHRLDFRWQQPWAIRDRVALLWPIDRPWAEAQVFPVSDDSTDALTLTLARSDVRVGRYRAQFVARNPWLPLDVMTRPQPGASSSIEITLGTVEERLLELETASTEREAFLDDLERACIAEGQGALQPTDLEWCLAHLELADVGEWPTLARLVQGEAYHAHQVTLGRYVFRPESLRDLQDRRAQGGLAADAWDLLSALTPEPSHWSDATCQTLAFGLFPDHTETALRELARRDIQAAVPILLAASERGSLSEDDVIQLLGVDRDAGLTALEHLPRSPQIQRLLRILKNQASRIRNEMWISTNIGHGQITRIEAVAQGCSVEAFMDDETEIVLHVALHRAIDPDMKGESVRIDLRTRECSFPRAKRLFVCERCGHTTGNFRIFRAHPVETHCGASAIAPPRAGQTVVLKNVSFNPAALRHESR
jgi:hypothetical protein